MAIAFDTSVDGSSTATNTLSWSHVFTGSNLIVFIGGFYTSSSTTDMTCTVGGVSATKIATSQQASGDSNKLFLFYLIAPSTGSQTVQLTCSASGGYLTGGSVSYSGANQAGQPDASSTSTTDSVHTKTPSITTIANNSWAVLFCRWQGSGTINNSGGNKLQPSSGGNYGLFDSGAPITPAGAYNAITVTNNGSDVGIGTIMASFSPLATVSTNKTSNFALMGVGQ